MNPIKEWALIWGTISGIMILIGIISNQWIMIVSGVLLTALIPITKRHKLSNNKTSQVNNEATE